MSHQRPEDGKPAGVLRGVGEASIAFDQDRDMVESALAVDELQGDDGRGQGRGAVGQDREIDDLGRPQGATLRPEPPPGGKEVEEAVFIENRGSPHSGTSWNQ
jgi:hypothetical protein